MTLSRYARKIAEQKIGLNPEWFHDVTSSIGRNDVIIADTATPLKEYVLKHVSDWYLAGTAHAISGKAEASIDEIVGRLQANGKTIGFVNYVASKSNIPPLHPAYLNCFGFSHEKLQLLVEEHEEEAGEYATAKRVLHLRLSEGFLCAHVRDAPQPTYRPVEVFKELGIRTSRSLYRRER